MQCENSGCRWDLEPERDDLDCQATDIYRVSAAGGEPRRILDPEPACKARLMPSFLPDGRHFLYGCFASPTKGTVNLGSIDSTATRSLIPSGSNAVYAPPRYLIYSRQGTLFARPFDLQTLRGTDESFPIAQQVGHVVPQRARVRIRLESKKR